MVLGACALGAIGWFSLRPSVIFAGLLVSMWTRAWLSLLGVVLLALLIAKHRTIRFAQMRDLRYQAREHRRAERAWAKHVEDHVRKYGYEPEPPELDAAVPSDYDRGYEAGFNAGSR